MREVRVFVCSLMFFLEHLRKPERLLHVHFYFDAHCTSAFRVDSPISIWPHYISVNQEMKLMHTIIKIAVVLVLSLFAIVGLVSISKAEETVWYCEMTTHNSIMWDQVINLELKMFKLKVTSTEIKFSKNYDVGPSEMRQILFSHKNFFHARSQMNNGSVVFDSNLSFSHGNLFYADVFPNGIVTYTARCDEF